ncbi:MAG: DUF4474 domain-containing protein [Clostridium sp.]|uniref:DUF4474 domain-containing protein n=1 Tax=Clostridium sp. TaxID=1506 RepID=UPI0025C2D3C6|nr:DUF4474 domain-containing protein [Clostridium sp.]MCE5222546.1 DUF4474 domain-containing protein [Clostridium sp.]
MVGDLISILAGIRIIKSIKSTLNKVMGRDKLDIDNSLIDKGIEIAGYGYDSEQDIFYCNMNPWQRNMGYSRLYDEGSAPFGMIVDCEPIYFKYEGKLWLIELWKGQYDLNTGCEVGVYTTEEPILNIPAMYKYMFYNCASNEDRLKMFFTLYKNGERLFERDDQHWWLAGFKLGEYSEPSELTMKLNITLKDDFMCKTFVEALEAVGYFEKEKEFEIEGTFEVNGNNVALIFGKPYTPQPITRTPETDRIIQAKNKILCDRYNDIVKVYDNVTDKINAIQTKAPEIYEEIMDKAKLRSYLRSMKNPENI